jgi:hypothetical protein
VHTCNRGLHGVGQDTRRHGWTTSGIGRNRGYANGEILAVEWGLRPFLALDVEL